MRIFDKKFGREFIENVPLLPGVYRIFDKSDRLIYVGKAKNLRRRLSQYRNARRLKKHLKMNRIIRHADRIEFEVCGSDLDACLLETRLIQQHRPKWNVVGAYHFLYPMIGVRHTGEACFFCYTTRPDLFPDFSFHGAFRSREITGEAFFSLMKLTSYIGHRIKAKAGGRIPYSYAFGFRQIDRSWMTRLESFFKGESNEALEHLILALVEHASARKARQEIQDHLNNLKRFWKHEIRRLKDARLRTGYSTYPVPQADRDLVFLRYRADLTQLRCSE